MNFLKMSHLTLTVALIIYNLYNMYKLYACQNMVSFFKNENLNLITQNQKLRKELESMLKPVNNEAAKPILQENNEVKKENISKNNNNRNKKNKKNINE
jgi:hypothetical protein